MRYPLQLVSDCLVQDRMIVAMDVRPDRRIAVQVASAKAVFEPRAAPRDQNKRLVPGRNPVCHLRERVPDVGFVEFGAECHANNGFNKAKVGVSEATLLRPRQEKRIDLTHERRSVINQPGANLNQISSFIESGFSIFHTHDSAHRDDR